MLTQFIHEHPFITGGIALTLFAWVVIISMGCYRDPTDAKQDEEFLSRTMFADKEGKLHEQLPIDEFGYDGRHLDELGI